MSTITTITMYSNDFPIESMTTDLTPAEIREAVNAYKIAQVLRKKAEKEQEEKAPILTK